MKHLSVVLTVALTSFMITGPARAGDDLLPGARVRVKARTFEVPGLVNYSRSKEETVVGEVVSIDDEALVVKLDGHETRLTIPITAVQKTEVSVKRHGRGVTAMRWMGLGFLGGAAVGLAMGDDHCNPPPRRPDDFLGLSGGCWFTMSATDKALGLGTLAALVGGLGGLAAGPGDQWKGITLTRTPNVKVSLRPLGHTGLALRVGF